MYLVPLLDHLAAKGEIFRRDDLGPRVGVVLLEAVAVVTLGLQLLSVKLGELFDGIDVVIGVSVGRKGKFSGIKRFQKRFPVVRHAAQAEFFSALLCVLHDLLQGGPHVAISRRIKIGRNTVLGQPLGHVAADFGDLAVVALPEIHVVERVVCAGKIGGIQDIMDPAVVVNRRFMKVQHKNLTVFLCSSNSILHLSIAWGGIC